MPAVKAVPSASPRAPIVSFMGALPTGRSCCRRDPVAARQPTPYRPFRLRYHVATSPAPAATGSRQRPFGAVPHPVRRTSEGAARDTQGFAAGGPAFVRAQGERETLGRYAARRGGRSRGFVRRRDGRRPAAPRRVTGRRAG